MKSAGIILALHKRRALEVARQLCASLSRQGIAIRMLPEAAAQLSRKAWAAPMEEVAGCDLAIVLGGDGSVLATARAAAPQGTPILAVDLGGFGFLAEARPSELLVAVRQFQSGDYRVEERMMLAAAVERGGAPGESCIGLNDAVITKGAFSRLMRLHTSVNDQFVANYPADGLIVSTPTGSTAYSLSAGGPIVHPDERLLLITPICAHTLFTRPLVVGDDEIVRINMQLPRARQTEVMLTVDGQIGIPLRNSDVITIRKAKHPARFVRFGEPAFYRRLRQKMKWGGRL